LNALECFPFRRRATVPVHNQRQLARSPELPVLEQKEKSFIPNIELAQVDEMNLELRIHVVLNFVKRKLYSKH
jgi:hypothetical protein